MGFRAVKIDTLSLVKELEDSGIPKAQAEAQLRTTIKVLDMVTEEKLATKHDLTHGLHQLEEKLSAKIHKVDIKIDKLEEKLNTRMDKMEDKLSTEISAGRKETQELKERVINIENKMEHLFSSVLLKMTAVAVFCTTAILGAILKFH